MTPAPGWRKCTAYRRPGAGGMPLALRLSKWLGLAPFCVGRPLPAASGYAQTPLGEPDKVRVLHRLCEQPRSVRQARQARVAWRHARREEGLDSLRTTLSPRRCENAKKTLVPRCARGALPEKAGVATMVGLRGLTFEISGRQRHDASARMAKMYRVPPAGRWWHAVGAPLEQVVRPCTVLLLGRQADTTFLRQVTALPRLPVNWESCTPDARLGAAREAFSRRGVKLPSAD